MERLEGKVAVVTGGAQGLGEAIVREFVNQGAQVVIGDILEKEGYITKYDIIVDGIFKTIRVTLKYGADKNEKIITGIKRISKPGLRVYAGKDKLPKVLGGLGIAILSTNQGIITDKEARKLQVGGEVLAFVW